MGYSEIVIKQEKLEQVRHKSPRKWYSTVFEESASRFTFARQRGQHLSGAGTANGGGSGAKPEASLWVCTGAKGSSSSVSLPSWATFPGLLLESAFDSRGGGGGTGRSPPGTSLGMGRIAQAQPYKHGPRPRAVDTACSGGTCTKQLTTTTTYPM